MCSFNLVVIFLLVMISFDPSIQGKLDLGKIKRKLAQICYQNRDNYLKKRNVIKCNITYDVSCWPETEAGQIVVQPCPFLLFSPKDNISRRCDRQGKWSDMNITSCRRLSSEEAVQKGKELSNSQTDQKESDDSRTHHDRVQKVYLAFSWMSFLILLPTFLIICIVMSSENERFNFHKNLILAFILRTVTFFVHYYGKLGEDDANQTTCNVFWMLNRYFAASEITWMLNEAIFLLSMLVYPLENDSFFWYYFLFGWGFSGLLTFCVYLPYAQFKLSRSSSSCWVAYSQSHHMLVLYVPLTIMLVINFLVAVYVVYVLVRKLKDSNANHFDTFKKGAKATVVLISLLGFVYLLTFYQPEHNKEYQYFVAAIYPFQGVLVCVFCVFVNSEFREALRRRWMKWRYGQVIDSTPSAEIAGRSRIQSAGENEATTNRESRAVPSKDSTDKALSKTHQPGPSSESTPSIDEERSQASMLSRSSDLTKFRMTKVEPEPAIPLRINAASPEDWSPPFHRASKAWEESQDSLQICNESRSSLSNANEGYLAGSESDLTFKGIQLPLTVVKPSFCQLGTQTHELQMREHLSEEGLHREIRELEESTNAVPTGSKTLTSCNDYPMNEVSVFSSLQPESDDELVKGEESNKLMDSSLSRTVDQSTASTKTSVANLPNGSEPPTKLGASSFPIDNEVSTKIAGPSCSYDAQVQHADFEGHLPEDSRGQSLWKKSLHSAHKLRRGSEMVQPTESACSLQSADVFPVVAFLPPKRKRSNDRKYVCASPAGDHSNGPEAPSKIQASRSISSGMDCRPSGRRTAVRYHVK